MIREKKWTLFDILCQINVSNRQTDLQFARRRKTTRIIHISNTKIIFLTYKSDVFEEAFTSGASMVFFNTVELLFEKNLTLLF